jgi:hypothetical protein
MAFNNINRWWESCQVPMIHVNDLFRILKDPLGADKSAMGAINRPLQGCYAFFSELRMVLMVVPQTEH